MARASRFSPEVRARAFGTPEVLELDLRQVAQMGVGRDATEWYRALRH